MIQDVPVTADTEIPRSRPTEIDDFAEWNVDTREDEAAAIGYVTNTAYNASPWGMDITATETPRHIPRRKRRKRK